MCISVPKLSKDEMVNISRKYIDPFELVEKDICSLSGMYIFEALDIRNIIITISNYFWLRRNQRTSWK
jgi:hypothetical protein